MTRPPIVLELIAEERRLLLMLEKVRELLTFYEPNMMAENSSQELRSRSRVHTARSEAANADDDAVLNAAENLIDGRTNPTPTMEILGHLQATGVHVGGKVPRNNLSSKLSHSPRFIAHGKRGWTLAHGRNDAGDTSREAPDDDAADGESSGASFGAGVGRSGASNGADVPVS